ncbi:LysB family phage lysis regulatory protein [Iodobacter ciconiae]|uniref:LysB family phage lysis regulatory protein n=1 Tax=Iodobacter ciconiae TaxID=2496266 RepID=A0A3S8ZPZ4_9NEIS|nr:Rz-like lysis system protein LysB [Iodobacter ciconiae]AZN35535.1 LysB family phage lysis regulatory protein [Iodobacter ciconiae]
MSRITTIALVALCFMAALLLAINLHQGQKHKAELLQLELTASEQDKAQQTALLEQLYKVSSDNDAAQADLRSSIESVNTALLKNKRAMEQLKNESKEVRDWADTRLPADVVRLRQRPDIASAAAYRDWLSQRDGLPSASEPSPNQWRAQSGN